VSAIIIIQQRTHQKDITGLILSKELGYEWLCLPMEHERGRSSYTPVRRPGVKPKKMRRIKLLEDPLPTWVPADKVPEGAESVGPVRLLTNWEFRTEEGELLSPRVGREYLDTDLKPTLQAMGGTYAESGQLQQRPVPRGGGMFQRDDFQILEVADLPPGLRPARGYDLAATEDDAASWTAGVKIAVSEPMVIILHADRIHGSPGQVERWMKATAATDGKGVVIDFPQDPGQAGKWQKAYLGGQFQGYEVRSSTESGSKANRAIPLASQCELGNVYLLRGDWNDTFIAEACLFPRGDFKDLIDAATRAYARAIKLKANVEVPAAPKTIGG
jgi:predicted phage terminase large subunit-like protein